MARAPNGSNYLNHFRKSTNTNARYKYEKLINELTKKKKKCWQIRIPHFDVSSLENLYENSLQADSIRISRTSNLQWIQF